MQEKYEVTREQHEIGLIAHVLSFLGRAHAEARYCLISDEILELTSRILEVHTFTLNLLSSREEKNKYIV
jgi:hypothetical protein